MFRVVLMGMLAIAQPAHAWLFRLDPQPLRCGIAGAVVTDGAGDVYAAGVTYECTEIEGGPRPAIVKLRAADGASLWRRESLEGASGECAAPAAAARDAAGSIALWGNSSPCFDDGLPNEAFAAALDPTSGGILWLENLADGPNVAGAVAGDLHVVAAGSTLVGLDRTTGATRWSRPLGDRALALHAAAEHVYVAVADGTGVRVARHEAASGEPAWSAAVPGEPRFDPVLLRAGPAFGIEAVVVAAGFVKTVMTNDGSILWSRALGVDQIVGVAIEPTGDVLMSSFVRGGFEAPSNLLLVHRFEPFGFEATRRQLSGGPSAPGVWLMDAAQSGDLLFAGSGAEGRLLAVDGDALAPRWDWRLDGARLTGDPLEFRTVALTSDPDGHVLLGGSSTAADDIEDVREGGAFAVMKRSAATGGSFPCGDGQLDAGEACDDGGAVDGDGCDASCRPSGCGSGRVSDGEECDDGNTEADDGCSPTCTLEPGCGALDVRGRWEAHITCALRDAFGQNPFQTGLDATFSIDLGQDCATGAVQARVPAACGALSLVPGGEATLSCTATAGTLPGSVQSDGNGVVFHDVAASFRLGPALAAGSCSLVEMQTGGSIALGAEVDRPRHASRLRGALVHAELALANRAGAICLEKHPDGFCTIEMQRVGPAEGSCALGCDDADACTVDGCDAFGWCTNERITQGTAGAICAVRHAVAASDACTAEDRQQARLLRLLGRLDPAWADGPRWLLRAHKRVLGRIDARLGRLVGRGAVSRSCGRILRTHLRAVRRSLSDAMDESATASAYSSATAPTR